MSLKLVSFDTDPSPRGPLPTVARVLSKETTCH